MGVLTEIYTLALAGAAALSSAPLPEVELPEPLEVCETDVTPGPVAKPDRDCAAVDDLPPLTAMIFRGTEVRGRAGVRSPSASPAPDVVGHRVELRAVRTAEAPRVVGELDPDPVVAPQIAASR